MSYTIIIVLALAAIAATLFCINSIKTQADLKRQNDLLQAQLTDRTAEVETLKTTIETDRTTSDNKISELNSQLNAERIDKTKLQERLSFIEEERDKQQQQLAETLELERKRMATESEHRFNVLARSILDDNTKRFNEHSEQRLGTLLTPLKEELDRLQRAVNDTYSNESRERFALSERIKELVQLNETIGREAKDLTRALRGDSKVQGDWGEMILETLLEKSGLKKGIHFDLQVTTDADGNTIKDSQGNRLRPDAVINYPDGRCIIVDSKVSLTAYIQLVNSDPTDPMYQELAKSHLQSVKSHIQELANKNYQDYVGDKKCDFVTMFIPNEGAYLAAMNLEPSLWEDAYEKRVVIVSPTHLISFLKLAEQIWRQDDMKRNWQNIADESGKMYDKFVGFVDDMDRIKKGLTDTQKAFDGAMNKLSVGNGNLVRKAEQIRQLGAKATKQLSQTLKDRSEE